jgi:hypothetical protein
MSINMRHHFSSVRGCAPIAKCRICRLGLTATIVLAALSSQGRAQGVTNVTSPGLSDAAVNHALEPVQRWAFIIFPTGYSPLGVSDTGTAFFSKDGNVQRWTAGSFTPLAPSRGGTSGFGNYVLNRNGAIAVGHSSFSSTPVRVYWNLDPVDQITVDAFVDLWLPGSTSPTVLNAPQISSRIIATSFNDDLHYHFFPIPGGSATWIDGNTISSIDPQAIDKSGNTWTIGLGSITPGTTVSTSTDVLGNVFTYITPPVWHRVSWMNGAVISGAANPVLVYESNGYGSTYGNYALDVGTTFPFAVNNVGSVISGTRSGSVTPPSVQPPYGDSGNEAVAYAKDGRALNYTPLFMNDSGTVLGTRDGAKLLEFTDGTQKAVPEAPGENITWVDDSNRPSGTFSNRPAFWQEVPNVAPISYVRNFYTLLKAPDGWSTDHRVAADSQQIQLGLLTNKTTQEQRAFMAIPAELAVDANRDGQIKLAAEDSSDGTSASKPFRFWINDDDGSMDTGGTDIPQGAGAGNGGLPQINGAKDLVNYFPVYFDITQLVQVLPPSAGYTYKISQADSAVNFVYTNLSVGRAFDYLRPPAPSSSDGAPNFQTVGPLQTGFGYNGAVCNEPITTAHKFAVRPSGVPLDAGWLGNITSSNWGVLLFDGRATTTNPLVLDVVNSGNVIVASISLPLQIGNIENMYRHVNLRSGADAPGGLVDAGSSDNGLPSNYTVNPPGFPDSVNGNNWIVQMHGYNVSGQSARGWEAEVFKQLYWSHSHAKFVGVCWFSDPHDSVGGKVSNYEAAVENAFISAQALANIVSANFHASGNVTTISHSLGSMMVSSAIADYGMNVKNAIFVDGAIASEAFDGNHDEDLTNMTVSSWVTSSSGGTTALYPRSPISLWASDWWQSFSSSDARATLTWQNRLSGASSKIYNFYSPTENVLAANPNDPSSTAWALIASALTSLGGDVGQFAWITQEKSKGNQTSILGLAATGSNYMGWGFNLMDPVSASDPIWYDVTPFSGVPNSYQRVVRSAVEVANMTYTSSNIARSPLFATGWGSYPIIGSQSAISARNVDPSTTTGPTWIPKLYDDTQGGPTAATNKNQLLAEAIPALSQPIGATPASAFAPNGLGKANDHNFNIPLLYVDPSHWPSSRPFDAVKDVPAWYHSDMHDVAYAYMFTFYDELVDIASQ